MENTNFFIESDQNNFIPNYKDVFDGFNFFRIKIEGFPYDIRIWREEELVGTVTVRESPPYTFDESEPYKWVFFLGEIIDLNCCDIEAHRKKEFHYNLYHVDAKFYYDKKTLVWVKAELKILDKLNNF